MSQTGIAQTPEPPYYAVIFTSLRTEGERGYGEMAERMMDLAQKQPGFLGADSVRNSEGMGITVSYWTTEESIHAWKSHADHQLAQQMGREVWYSAYELRVAKVERAYGQRG